ncbi:ImmA/IrrE family metallo-endopeptidase [Anaerofustis sp.]|uniref:ImmA/IrrE family metallo-endopeptidase n=1 Tax=Anaerofustis sp. TaxID=1872517 RepID=UPI0025C6EA2E|nr:ImmA/IrrE family metallo-endopeptidase [Anaerofustis sp.]
MNKARKNYILNTAIRTILRSKTRVLPVNLHEICKSLNIELHRFNDNKILVNAILREKKKNAFAILGVNNIHHIFYDDEKIPYEEVRETISHEIGHIVLKHTSILNNGKIEELEEEANLCGKHILIPETIIKECNMFNPDNIMVFCEITEKLANEIYENNDLYIEDEVNKKLQELLIKKFKDFIDFYN